jgi:5'-methylthioadenosine phosphorylase
MEGLEIDQEIRLGTPFGDPSDAYCLGTLEDKPVAFLARHGRGHRYPPVAVPYRANLYGFRLLGVENLFSVSAVGSLRESVQPLQMMVPDQFVDMTRHRPTTFFDQGPAVHVALADPVCPELSRVLAEACEQVGVIVHRGGTYVCIEGPQFSTRAESQAYRAQGMDVIGMTNATEARLAREAEIGYATLAMVCDYDCWHEEHESVTAEMAIENLLASADHAQSIIRAAIAALPADAPSSCAGVLGRAIVTHRDQITVEQRRRTAALTDRYLGDSE